MSFWGKIAKIASITMIATGGALTVTSAAMLGVGTNYTHTITSEGIKTTYGVGSMNYGKAWINGELVPSEAGSEKISYQEFVNEARKSYKEVKKEYDTLPEGDYKNQTKEMLSLFESIFTANDLMIAGAVLLPIFTIVLAVGIALIIINKKKS